MVYVVEGVNGLNILVVVVYLVDGETAAGDITIL